MSVLNVNNHSKSPKYVSLERLLYFFSANVNFYLFNVALRNYVGPKNIRIPPAFGKMEGY